MIFPAIYVSVTLFLIPSLYGDDDDLCKIAFEDEGLLDDAFDCNTTSLTNLTKESGRWNQTHADITVVLYISRSKILYNRDFCYFGMG
jgi:hypothetical protein